MIARLGLLLMVFGLTAFFSTGASFAADDKAGAAAHAKDDKAAHAEKEAHGGGHAHDTTDLGHGNGTNELGNPAALPFDLAIATFVVFVCLMLLLTKFAWGPISSALDCREQHIAEMIATAEKNAHASEMRMKELEAKLAAQAEAARDAINEARREGEIQKAKILDEAQSAAKREKDKAIEEIRSAKNLALREIAQKSVNTAVDLATTIIRREVKPADHEKLIADSLAQFHTQN